MTELQEKQIKKIEGTLVKLAEEKGWETTCKPINGREIEVTHTMTNRYGYLRTKTITINPDIDPEELADRLQMDLDRTSFPANEEKLIDLLKNSDYF